MKSFGAVVKNAETGEAIIEKMYKASEVDRLLAEIMDEVKYFGNEETIQKLRQVYERKNIFMFDD